MWWLSRWPPLGIARAILVSLSVWCQNAIGTTICKSGIFKVRSSGWSLAYLLLRRVLHFSTVIDPLVWGSKLPMMILLSYRLRTAVNYFSGLYRLLQCLKHYTLIILGLFPLGLDLLRTHLI